MTDDAKAYFLHRRKMRDIAYRSMHESKKTENLSAEAKEAQLNAEYAARNWYRSIPKLNEADPFSSKDKENRAYINKWLDERIARYQPLPASQNQGQREIANQQILQQLQIFKQQFNHVHTSTLPAYKKAAETHTITSNEASQAGMTLRNETAKLSQTMHNLRKLYAQNIAPNQNTKLSEGNKTDLQFFQAITVIPDNIYQSMVQIEQNGVKKMSPWQKHIAMMTSLDGLKAAIPPLDPANKTIYDPLHEDIATVEDASKTYQEHLIRLDAVQTNALKDNKISAEERKAIQQVEKETKAARQAVEQKLFLLAKELETTHYNNPKSLLHAYTGHFSDKLEKHYLETRKVEKNRVNRRRFRKFREKVANRFKNMSIGYIKDNIAEKAKNLVNKGIMKLALGIIGGLVVSNTNKVQATADSLFLDGGDTAKVTQPTLTPASLISNVNENNELKELKMITSQKGGQEVKTNKTKKTEQHNQSRITLASIGIVK